MLPDPVARRISEDLVSAVMEMYGHGLTRIVEILARAALGVGRSDREARSTTQGRIGA